MADLEIYFSAAGTGKAVTADFILEGNVSVAGHPFTEQATPGVFFADVPVGLAAGAYVVRPYLDGAEQVPFAFRWEGTKVIDTAAKVDDLHDFAGLNPNAALTITPTQKSVNGKTAAMSGDRVTSATQTRTA